MIARLTFTGVDEWTDVGELIRIAADARPLRIEWAVLAGTSTGKDPRFPAVETIAYFRSIAAEAGADTALHLCGRLARAVAAGDMDEAAELATGFGRIQVNAAAHDYALLAELGQRTRARVIAQEQRGFAEGGPPRADLDYLDDGSGGRGISQLHGWTTRWKGVRCGYAGGIRPENVRTAMRRAAAAGGAGAWIDMESGVRTNERLDTAKVRRVVQEALYEMQEAAAGGQGR